VKNFTRRHRDAPYVFIMTSCVLPIVAPVPPVLRDEALCTRYMARQPILDREGQTHAYEVLFRSGRRNFYSACDPDAASCNVIDLFLHLGFDPLSDGLVAFINCTRNILLCDVITLLPRDQVIVEVLEDVPADPEVVAACDRLRRAGYKIALDDYVPTPDTRRLLPFADIVKVDILATDAASQAEIAFDMHRRGISLAAEKVETREQFDLAQRLGFDYFQGYYLGKPEILTLHDLPCSKRAVAQLLSSADASTAFTNWSRPFRTGFRSDTGCCPS